MSSLKWRKGGTGGRSVDDPPGGKSKNAVGAKGAVADIDHKHTYFQSNNMFSSKDRSASRDLSF